MDGYEVNLYWSEADACYVAQIMEFAGCAVDGPTPEIALANLREFTEVWKSGVRANGFPIPEPRHAPNQMLAV
jgi:predicted RNase H-like HicB family nuclease